MYTQTLVCVRVCVCVCVYVYVYGGASNSKIFQCPIQSLLLVEGPTKPATLHSSSPPPGRLYAIKDNFPKSWPSEAGQSQEVS